MKILMVIRFLHYSGAPKMFLWVAKKLANYGNDVTIITWEKNTEVEIPKNIKVCEYNWESKGLLSKIRLLRHEVKLLNPDVSISFLLDSNILNILACFGLRTKSIICERNDPYRPRYYKLKLLKPLFYFADGAVFQLPQVAKFYNNIRKNVAIIPNPVIPIENTSLELLQNRKNVIISVGRLDIFQKRTDLLIDAFALFVKKNPSYYLHLCGTGSDEKRLKALVAGYHLDNSVKFLGKCSDPTKQLKEAKIFVLSSDFEGIPNALIEAMSIGLPCISTDCSPGGASFLINNGVNGLLVPKGDVLKIASAMQYLVDNPKKADELGVEARKISELFSEEKITDMWNEYINQFK